MASRGPPSGSRTRKSRWRVSTVSKCNVDVDVGRLLEYGNILEKEGKSGKNRGIFGYFVCLKRVLKSGASPHWAHDFSLLSVPTPAFTKS